MQPIIHRAESRGRADHGWLQSRHTFSFAGYHDPQRMGFGRLRVINDDVVAPRMGFATHPHDNMEIISVPITGTLRHQDSLGNVHIIRPGEVQVMSAGTGIRHSEYNDSAEQPVNFLQIWVLPARRDIAPRYGQREFPASGRHNRVQLVLSPDARAGSLEINQNAFFSLADLEAGQRIDYTFQQPENGLYLFVIAGRLTAAGERLAARDGMGLAGAEPVTLAAEEETRLLCMEVPLL